MSEIKVNKLKTIKEIRVSLKESGKDKVVLLNIIDFNISSLLDDKVDITAISEDDITYNITIKEASKYTLDVW